MDNSVMNARNDPHAHDLKRDRQGTLNDAEELVRMTGEQAGEKVNAARARMKDSLQRGRHELQRMQTQATDSARRAAYEVDDFVHANPWKTLAVVGLIGVVIGLLITRRDHDSY